MCKEAISSCEKAKGGSDRRLGCLFRMIHLEFSKSYNKKLECHNLSSSQSDLLNYLARTEKQQATQREIEQNLHLKNPTVTGLLNRLEEKNYVKRVPNPKDRRSHMVLLTDQSRMILSDMRKQALAMETKITDGFSQEEIDRLVSDLERILQNLSNI